jgi:CDP-6-deoxy-D-xylo-4-hexulose-3-dehydrase
MKKLYWPLIKNTLTWTDRLKLCYFFLTSTRYTNGAYVKKFEAAWAKWLGSNYALMTNSGSSANLLLLSAIKEKYKLQDNDKVLVPACTWSTSISPVLQLKLQPIFCDVNLDNFSFDLDHLAEIKLKHPDIKLVFATHLLGFAADSRAYQDLFPDAVVIDDICESHGCRDTNGVRCGANSKGATFSFYFGHHMTTIEGGMIVTDDIELFDLMKIKRSHGMSRESLNPQRYSDQYPDIDPQFLFVTDGYNFRSSEMNAVLGLSQLSRLDSFIDRRRRNFLKFTEIICQRSDLFYPITRQPGNSNYSFPLVCRSNKIMKKVKSTFAKAGIETRPLVSGNLLRQPFLKNYKFAVPRASYNADIINDCGFYIGNSQFVTDKQLDCLKDLINSL